MSDHIEIRWGVVEWIVMTAITIGIMWCGLELGRIANVAERAYPVLDGGAK